jgi:hypothetical protein
MGVLAVRQGGRSVDHNGQECGVVHLESLATVIDGLSTAPAPDLPASVFLESLGTWHGRFAAAQARVDQDLPPALAARAAAAQQKVRHALDRLTESGFSLPPTPEMLATDSIETRRWQWVSSGQQEPVEIELATAADGARDVRLAWALALLAVGVVASWALASAAVQTWLAQHAHFAVAVAGAVLMAAGIVPWLGAIILVLAVWRALHSAWPRRPAEATSTVLRRRS